VGLSADLALMAQAAALAREVSPTPLQPCIRWQPMICLFRETARFL
jgi:hypothetical protein